MTFWDRISAGWPNKLAPFLYALTLPKILTDFQSYFTMRIRRKFVIILSLKIPLHLKCVATPPCEMSNILKDSFPTQWRLPASAGWLSWIVDADRPSVEGHLKQYDRLDSSPSSWSPHNIRLDERDVHSRRRYVSASSSSKRTQWTFDVKLQDVTATSDNNWDNIHIVSCC